MNEEIISAELSAVKPCRVCGARDRNRSGCCRPCQKKRSQKYYEANRVQTLERIRRWACDNPDKRTNNLRKYREVNRIRVRESNRKWAKANPLKITEKNRKWLEANPEKNSIKSQNRRARKKANGGKLSADIARALLTKQNNKCVCCGVDLMQTGYHIDHIMPLVLGGLNDDSNVQLLTPKCNLSKGAKHPEVWAREKGIVLAG